MISYLQRDFSTAISKKNEAAFYAIVAKFLGIVCLAGPLLAVYDYVQVRAAEADLWRHRGQLTASGWSVAGRAGSGMAAVDDSADAL